MHARISIRIIDTLTYIVFRHPRKRHVYVECQRKCLHEYTYTDIHIPTCMNTQICMLTSMYIDIAFCTLLRVPSGSGNYDCRAAFVPACVALRVLMFITSRINFFDSKRVNLAYKTEEIISYIREIMSHKREMNIYIRQVIMYIREIIFRYER